MPLGQVAGVALKKAAKKLRDKLKKKATGKPKGRSPSMVLGSASKAGMQSKQGQRIKKRPVTPGFPGKKPRPPKSVYFRKLNTKKPGSKR